jgi:hypothetical protein
MNAKYHFERIEIAFWDALILLMSDSQIVKTAFQKSYGLVQVARKLHFLTLTLAWAAAGLSIGFALGLLRSAVH